MRSRRRPGLAYNPAMREGLIIDSAPAATSISVIDCSLERDLSALEPQDIMGRLRSTGAVLLPQFEPELQEFEAFTRQFCRDFHRSAARDGLRDLGGDGFTARTPDANFTLLAHTEGSYRPFDPADLAFFLCLEPPGRPGGETLLVDGRAFLGRMPGRLRSRFEDGGVIFEARWVTERWQAELGVDDAMQLPLVAERYPDFEYALEGGEMSFRCRRSAIHRDAGGQPVFANAILAHLPAVSHPRYRDARVYTRESNRVSFGDGQPLADEVIDTLIDIQDEVACTHRPQRGDLLIIDNTRVMHGRRPTQGECRRVLLTRFGYVRGELRRSGEPIAA